MNACLRQIPVGQARMNRDGNPFTRLAELDAELLAPHDDGEAAAGIRVPGHRLARLEHKATNDEVVASADDLHLHLAVSTSTSLTLPFNCRRASRKRTRARFTVACEAHDL